ncbi:pilus assembly protein [Asticcacaulis sp. EMRT-3]|uniref:TadE/TadG family type IV pilus assembly protein n=1 Tax=Asticcacaulis sp. EMRT-3 TaxID=3040349 RepID=UPI0024AEC872|nr:pilus assembly protein [Asticcacaulis sp. EMRT-3]MDI7773906.1 pilus assembly protein [Asticcacaulis sp. EMRT-3]
MTYRETFFRATRGNVTTIVALAAIPLLMGAMAALEFTDMSNAHARLQAAVDEGALSGAGQLAVATTTSGDSAVLDNAQTVAQQTLASQNTSDTASFTASIGGNRSSVTVDGYTLYKPITGILGVQPRRIAATATAETMQRTPLCVLQTDSSGGIDIKQTGQIRASGCAVHANADIHVADGGLIKADQVQAVGSISGSVDPQGQQGALRIDDPFASLDLSLAKKQCQLGGGLLPIHLGSGTMDLPPGLHCLPITVLGNGTLHLEPGDHYFFAPLIMSGNSILEGDDVDLIFGGVNVFNFSQNATVELSARRSGPFAGFLIATSRDNHGVFTIASGHVSKLLGTIYIPNSQLVVDTGGNVAQDSSWSVIVAKDIALRQNPVLVINSNYVGSGVPVPAGVGPSKMPVLSR